MKRGAATWFIAAGAVLIIALLTWTEANGGNHSNQIRVIKMVSAIILTIAVSLFILIQSAHLVIFGLKNYSRHTGLSPTSVGLIILAIGTSLPDLSAAVFASLRNQGSIIAGAVLGANMLNVTVVTGLGLLTLKKPVTFNKTKLHLHPIATYLLALLPLTLIKDGIINRAEGGILILAYLLYMSRVLYHSHKQAKLKRQVKVQIVLKDSFIIIGCTVALLLGGRWLVTSFNALSHILGTNQFTLGLIIVSFATSLPELVVSIKSFYHREVASGLGNALGSICINSSLVLGFAALIAPIVIPIELFWKTSVLLIASVSLFFIVVRTGSLDWKKGILLLAPYAVFLVLVLV